jgi:thiamine pyrophosphate-dependent acetolactate synthase large subunit-like protein
MTAFDDSLQAAANHLFAACCPVILVGPEGAAVAPLLLQIADRLGAAVLTTPDAKSVIDDRRSCGTFSFGASAFARQVIERADVVLAVSALGEFSCRLGEAFRRHTLIQVTERVTSVGRNLEPTISLVGPALDTIVEQLWAALARRVPNARAAWFTELSEAGVAEPRLSAKAGLIHPRAAIAAIEAALPESARVCIDVTSGALHVYQHLKLTVAQRAFSSIENGACMGEALMASLGIRLASNLPTLALVGDWGYCMAPSEIHTAVELELDRFVVLIWANGGGAFIGAGVAQQRIRVPDRVWRWSSAPDFAQVARGYGAHGVTVTDAEALENELSRALRGSGPVIIEAKIDPAVPVPAGDRFLSLGDARP